MGVTKFGPSSILLFALMVCWASMSEAGPSRALRVKVSTETSEFLLQPGKSIPVSITVVDSNGTGVENIHLKLASNTGKFQKYKDKGNGRYIAQWLMPKKKYPQAAILAAKVPGAPPGFTIIKLRSATNLPTKTSKPRVSVTMDIGGRKYGPVKSDDTGHVVIPVKVSPGEQEATATAIDEFGNRKTRKIKIPQPRYSRIVGFAERSTIEADGVSSSPVYLISALASGIPDSSLKIVAYRKGGKLSPSKRLQAGLYMLNYIAPARRNKKKRVSLTLADKSNQKKSRVKFTFSLNAGHPSKLELSFHPPQLTADGRSSSKLVIMVKDRGGNPLDGQSPALKCDQGVVEPVIETGGGSYQSRFTPAAGARGDAVCHALLKLKSKKEIETHGQLKLLASVPSAIEVSLSKNHLLMDGVSTSRLDIRALDIKGEGLDGVDIKLRAGKGSLDTVSSDGNGSYHANYTAPRGKMSTKVRIFVTAGQGEHPIIKDIVVDLEGLTPPPPPAPWVTLGPSGALLTNFALMTSGGFSVNLGVKVPGLGGYVYLDLESGYRHGVNDRRSGADETVETTVGFSPLHLAIVIKAFPHSVFTPTAALGGGVEFVQWSISTADSNVERHHDILMGSFAMLGGEVKLGPGAIVLSVKYLYAFLRDEAPLGTNDANTASRIKGNVGGLDVSLGYELHF